MAASPEHSPAPSDPSGMRVLVVDDNADNRDTTAALIRTRGHETLTAASGPEAILKITSFAPDLMLLDVAMPGMDGIEVANTVRRMPDIPAPVIAALTGYGDAFHRQRCAEAGFDFFLVKPAAANDFDFLLWITGQTSRLRDAFRLLKSEHKAAFYAFAVSQLDYTWLVLNCAAAQEEVFQQRSLAKVQRMQDRTAKWLKMSGGFTPEQKAALETMLAALQGRLATMKGDGGT
jgi:CheY-like chemotaxis protein